MKKIKLINVVLLATSFIVLTSSHPVPSLILDVNKKESKLSLEAISVESFISLSGKEFKELNGGKATLKEKFFFQVLKYNLKKEVKRNELSPSHTLNIKSKLAAYDSGFNFGGFALGFFLGFIGVLIAHLISDDPAIRKSSWYGVGAWFAIWIILYLAVFSALV